MPRSALTDGSCSDTLCRSSLLSSGTRKTVEKRSPDKNGKQLTKTGRRRQAGEDKPAKTSRQQKGWATSVTSGESIRRRAIEKRKPKKHTIHISQMHPGRCSSSHRKLIRQRKLCAVIPIRPLLRTVASGKTGLSVFSPISLHPLLCPYSPAARFSPVIHIPVSTGAGAHFAGSFPLF